MNNFIIDGEEAKISYWSTELKLYEMPLIRPRSTRTFTLQIDRNFISAKNMEVLKSQGYGQPDVEYFIDEHPVEITEAETYFYFITIKGFFK